jgi:DNA-binding MarR family transcriptional regulator
MKPETFHSLNNKVKTMAERYMELERKPRRFHSGIEMFSGEMHLLETIGDQPGCSVTALAGWFGVSKGAVSQTLKRLDKKNLIVRETDPRNLSRVRLSLNKAGQAIYKEHKEWHRQRLDGGLLDLMNDLSEEEGQFLHRSFDRFNRVLQEMIRLNL